ncbi:hypothetical protein BCR44DRAFT_1498880 [Catenaria anguillulae PL171]|uniref:Uncharacterized protein n=1 Tax=Catenaria anguillulae PL171 TaxID=765915 RepID=A0A1Y2HPA9_9FUNG|nr:hypothetical protein BCR44DRAFT_1498880 [Catenaria anguillulae PL171]
MARQACDLHLKILLVDNSGVGTHTFLDSFTDEVDDMSICSLFHLAKTRTVAVDGKLARVHIRPSGSPICPSWMQSSNLTQTFPEMSTDSLRRKFIRAGYFRESLPIGISATHTMSVRFVETSAKANVEVDQVFMELAKDMKRQWDKSQQVLMAAKAVNDTERTQ